MRKDKFSIRTSAQGVHSTIIGSEFIKKGIALGTTALMVSGGAAFADEITETPASTDTVVAEAPADTVATLSTVETSTPVEEAYLEPNPTVYTEPIELTVPEAVIDHSIVENAIEKAPDVIIDEQPVVEHVSTSTEETAQIQNEIKADYTQQAQDIQKAQEKYTKDVAEMQAQIEKDRAEVDAINEKREAEYKLALAKYNENVKQRAEDIKYIESKPVLLETDKFEIRGQYDISKTDSEFYSDLLVNPKDEKTIILVSRTQTGPQYQNSVTVLDKNGKDVTKDRLYTANNGQNKYFGYDGAPTYEQAVSEIVGTQYIFKDFMETNTGQKVTVKATILDVSKDKTSKTGDTHIPAPADYVGGFNFESYAGMNGSLGVYSSGALKVKYEFLDEDLNKLPDNIIVPSIWSDVDYGQVGEFSNNVYLLSNDYSKVTQEGTNKVVAVYKDADGNTVETAAENLKTVEGSLLTIIEGNEFTLNFNHHYDENKSGNGKWEYTLFGSKAELKTVATINEPTLSKLPYKQTDGDVAKPVVKVQKHEITKEVTTVFIDEKGNKVHPTADELQQYKELEGFTFVRTAQDEHSNVVHVYHKVVTNHVDKDSNELAPTEDGKTNPKEDLDGYKHIDTVVAENGDVTHVYHKSVTNFVDEHGNPLLPTVDGIVDATEIPGYEVVDKIVDPKTGDVTHVYRPVIVTPTVASTSIQTKTQTPTQVTTPVGTSATTQTPAQLTQEVKELPSTGAGTALGTFSVLIGATSVAGVAKFKKRDE